MTTGIVVVVFAAERRVSLQQSCRRARARSAASARAVDLS
jgi:hypothetical protein